MGAGAAVEKPVNGNAHSQCFARNLAREVSALGCNFTGFEFG